MGVLRSGAFMLKPGLVLWLDERDEQLSLHQHGVADQTNG